MTANQAGSLSDSGGGYWQGTFSTSNVEMLNEYITAFSDGLYGLTANTTGIQFDAGTQYMWGADEAEYDTTTLTLAVWFYPTKVSGAQFMISRYSDRYHFAIYIESNNVARLYYCNAGGGTVFVDILDGATFTLDTWTHLVITVDGTTYNSWLNGVHVVDDGVMANVLQGGTAAIVIGQRDAGSLGTWDYEGYISDFFLYNIALTDTQCEALYRRDEISTNRVLKFTGFGHLGNSVYENAVWYDNSGNNYHLYGYNGVSIEAGVTGARYARPIFDRMILNVSTNYDWTLLDHNITLLASGIYDYDDTTWAGVATFNTSTYPTYGTVGIYYFNITSATDTNYGLTVLTTDYASAVWDNITVDSSFYYVQEMPTGDKFFTIMFSQLKWQYNDSYIGADWLCENIRDTTVTSTSTTSSLGWLVPYTQNVPIPSEATSITYHNNATKTIGSRSFEIQWYSVTTSVAATLDIDVENVAVLDTTLSVSGTNNVDFNWSIYNEGVLSGETGEITGTAFEIEFNKVLTGGLHNYSIFFNTTSSGSRWFNSTYFVDFDLNIDPPEVKGDNVEVRGTTNLACNYYVYVEGVFSDEEGSITPTTFSFFFTKQTATGLHNYSLYFNVSASLDVWKNGSYYVSASVLVVAIESWAPLTSDIRLTGTTNYPFTYYVYREGIYASESGSISSSTSFSFTIWRNTTVGEHVYQVYFNSSSVGGSRWFNFTDILSATLNIDIESWSPLTSTIRLTGTNNYPFTYYVYWEGVYNSETDTISSSTSFSFTITRNTTVGEHVYQAYFNSSSISGSRWFNFTDIIAAATTLDIDIESWAPLTSDIRLTGSTNSPFTYYVYREGVYNSETATISSSTSFSFTLSRNTSVGEHAYQVYFNSSSISGSRWFNFTDILSSTLDIDIEDWAPLTSTIRITGSCNAPFSYYAYREGVYNGETGTAGADSTSFSFEIARNTDAGEHLYQIYFNSSTLSGVRWFNFTDTVSTSYAWMHIKLSDQSGQLVDYALDVYVNGSLIFDPLEFYGRTDSAYEIAIHDKFGDELHNQTYSAPSSRQYNITLLVYSLKIKSWVDGKVLFYLYSSGGGSQSTWLAWDGEHEWHVFGSKTYQLRWTTDSSNIGTWGHGDHYFPALDSQGLTPSPVWYEPAGAVLVEVDAYGIAHLYDHIPDETGGGGDFTQEDADMVIQSFVDEMNPLLLNAGKGRLSLIIIAIFGVLSFSQYFFTNNVYKKMTSPSNPSLKERRQRAQQMAEERRRSTHQTKPQTSSSKGKGKKSRSV
jgi:hypothetical protein